MMLVGTSDMAMTVRALDAIFASVMFDNALVKKRCVTSYAPYKNAGLVDQAGICFWALVKGPGNL